MRGERVKHTTVAARFGVAGDRGWAVKDEIAGEIRSAKRLADLLQCAARYVVEPSEVDTPTVEVTLPDGRVVHSDDPSVHGLLSEFLGRPVTLWPRVSATEPEHYLRREAIDEAEMRRHCCVDGSLPVGEGAVVKRRLRLVPSFDLSAFVGFRFPQQ
jgi:uncharacterized protein YcbX